MKSLEFQTPEGESAQYLYICFAEMPEAWSMSAPARFPPVFSCS